MIRTHEELDAIEKQVKSEEHELQCSGLWEMANALIATARSAIPRPIREAPKDGTRILCRLKKDGSGEIVKYDGEDCWETDDNWLFGNDEILDWLPIPTLPDSTAS